MSSVSNVVGISASGAVATPDAQRRGKRTPRTPIVWLLRNGPLLRNGRLLRIAGRRLAAGCQWKKQNDTHDRTISGRAGPSSTSARAGPSSHAETNRGLIWSSFQPPDQKVLAQKFFNTNNTASRDRSICCDLFDLPDPLRSLLTVSSSLHSGRTALGRKTTALCATVELPATVRPTEPR